MTVAATDTVGRPTARRLRGFVQLLGSGVLGAAGLTAIVSNRWQVLDGATAVFVLLFIQWQSFCLTIAKCGLDYMVFATVSQDPALHYDLRAVVSCRIAPLSAAVGFVALIAFPLWASAAIAVSVVVDSYSLMVMAETNARSRFGTAAVANLLNYPLFFVLLFMLSQRGAAGALQVTAVFVLTSAARALWLGLQRQRPAGAKVVVPATQAPIAAQQAGNYGLFRADQLLLGLPIVSTWLGATPSFVASYLFLAKLPELAAGVLTTAGTVLFPVLFDAEGGVRRELRGARGAVAAMGTLAGLAVVGTAYVQLWRGTTPLTLAGVIPFLVHAALILPVNAVTYAMLSHGFVSGLLRLIAIGLCTGGCVALLSLVALGGRLLAWVVPVQLTTFLLIAALFGWGRSSVLYRERGARPSTSI